MSAEKVQVQNASTYHSGLRRCRALLCAAAVVIAAGLPARARAQHATAFDIEDGKRVFQTSCANCHGPDGNLIAGIDLQPCGGTHLRHTGQLGMILIRGCTKIRQDWRIEFVCGNRAESVARRDAALIEQVSEALLCAPQDLSASVRRLLLERESAAKRLKTLVPKVAAADAATLLATTSRRSDGSRVVAKILEGVEADYFQHLASSLAGEENVSAFFADAESGNLIFAQHPKSTGDMNRLLKKVLEQFPGKGGGSRNFARGALRSAKDCTAAIQLAETVSLGASHIT